MTDDTITNTDKTEESGNKSKLPLIISGFLIAALVASYFIFPGFHDSIKEAWDVLRSGDNERISEWFSKFGLWGPVFIIVAMVLQMFLFIINSVALILVSILAYGPFWGGLIAITAIFTASTIGYIIGKALGEAGVSKLIGQKSERKVSKFMDNYGVWTIIIARISPFLSDDAISFVAGFAKMSYLKFIFSTLAGIIPLVILLAWLGQDYERLKTGLIWISAISLVFFVGYVIYDKYFNKSGSN